MSVSKIATISDAAKMPWKTLASPAFNKDLREKWRLQQEIYDFESTREGRWFILLCTIIISVIVPFVIYWASWVACELFGGSLPKNYIGWLCGSCACVVVPCLLMMAWNAGYKSWEINERQDKIHELSPKLEKEMGDMERLTIALRSEENEDMEDLDFRTLKKRAQQILQLMGAEIYKIQNAGEGTFVNTQDDAGPEVDQFKSTYRLFEKYSLVSGGFGKFFPDKSTAKRNER